MVINRVDVEERKSTIDVVEVTERGIGMEMTSTCGINSEIATPVIGDIGVGIDIEPGPLWRFENVSIEMEDGTEGCHGGVSFLSSDGCALIYAIHNS